MKSSVVEPSRERRSKSSQSLADLDSRRAHLSLGDSSLGLVVRVQRKDLKAIGWDILLLLLNRDHRNAWLSLRTRSRTIITRPVNFGSLILGSRHHAGARKHSVVDSIRLNLCVLSCWTNEFDGDDDAVVDVLKVIADRSFGVAGGGVVYQDVAGCANIDLVGNVVWQGEVALGPEDLNLGGC